MVKTLMTYFSCLCASYIAIPLTKFSIFLLHVLESSTKNLNKIRKIRTNLSTYIKRH